MERLTLRDDDGRAIFTPYGLQIYCSTQATADCICKLEEALHAAHPEPTYPTWGEWLTQLHLESLFVYEDPAYILQLPIPADIAQKLGIKPKEG